MYRGAPFKHQQRHKIRALPPRAFSTAHKGARSRAHFRKGYFARSLCAVGIFIRHTCLLCLTADLRANTPTQKTFSVCARKRCSALVTPFPRLSFRVCLIGHLHTKNPCGFLRCSAVFRALRAHSNAGSFAPPRSVVRYTLAPSFCNPHFVQRVANALRCVLTRSLPPQNHLNRVSVPKRAGAHARA